MKLNFLTVSIIATLVILAGGVFMFTRNTSSEELTLPAPTTYEYYWSETCPHCKKVNNFFETWEGKDKIQIEKYEINESRDNQSRFVQRGRECGIARNQLGVPLLVTPNGACLTGDEPIIEHYKGLTFE